MEQNAGVTSGFYRSRGLSYGELSTPQNQSAESPLNPPDEPSLELKSLSEVYEELKQDLAERTGTPKYKIGLTNLDDVLWGLHKKELLTIGARTSSGKSMMAVHIARELVEQDQKVIYFSLEMNKAQLLERVLSNVCMISLSDLRRGESASELLEKDSIFRDWLKDAKLLIDDKYGYSFNNILKVCDVIRPDFVIVDYVQLVSTKGFRDKLAAIEDFVKELHLNCINRNFGAILLSQINRSGTDNPTMDKLKWSGVLEEISDTVMLLEWDWVKNNFFIRVEKQRHGMCGKTQVLFEPHYSRFSDLPAPPTEPTDRRDWE